MHDLRLLRLRRPDGLVVRGATLAQALDAIAGADSFFRAAVSWDQIAGPDAAVDAEALHAAARRWFGWEELLDRAATALAAFGFSYSATVRAQRRLLELALEDTWPCEVEDAPVLVAAARRTTTPASTASERGLLWLIANAIDEPWTSAREPLLGEAAERRFARLAMVATGMTTIPAHLRPTPRADTSGLASLPTTAALLGDGRLAERDVLIRWLVRAVELYDELLPSVLAEAGGAFERRVGLSIRAWIVKALSLSSLVEHEVANRSVRRARFELGQLSVEQDRSPTVALLRSMAATPAKLQALLRETRSRASDQTLAFEPIRRYPLLDLGENCFVVLHKDFIAAAADDGVWYALNDELGPRFGSAFGVALERYIERVLRRCASNPGHALARVPESRRSGVLRCDFAWRVGPDLILLDAKRSGLSSAHLMGDPQACTRLEDQVGHAFLQLLATHRSIKAGELDDVIEQLGVPRSWRPRHTIPVVVTHRPVFVFFSSAETILSRLGVASDWAAEFTGLPVVWSLSDVELLEAALPEIDFTALIRAVASREPITTCGVPPYLHAVGYTGPTASPYFDARRHEILAPFTEPGTSPSAK
jgi:hypothetical protein